MSKYDYLALKFFGMVYDLLKAEDQIFIADIYRQREE